MARASAFGTSLGVHAAVLAAVLMVPLIRVELPPELRTGPVADMWPDIVPVARPNPRPHASAPLRPAPRDAQPQRSALPSAAAPVPIEAEADETPLDVSLPMDSYDVGLVTGSDTALADSRGFGDVSSGSGSGARAEPQRVGGAIVPPAKLVDVAPEYPEIARIARVSGTVVLDCTIDPAGNVVDVRVLSGNPLLAPSAVEAVSRWRYTPSRLNGVPVSVLMTVTVRFDMKR